ncbi:MAG: NAD-dependent epimerase/dehydratase family protein [Xanthobacteraceae bacterium]
MDFDGLHVVVTGGTGTLGQAVVAALIDAGATCHILQRVKPNGFLSAITRSQTLSNCELGNESSVDRCLSVRPLGIDSSRGRVCVRTAQEMRSDPPTADRD